MCDYVVTSHSLMTVVPNLFISAYQSTFDDFIAAYQKGGETQIVFNSHVFENVFKI